MFMIMILNCDSSLVLYTKLDIEFIIILSSNYKKFGFYFVCTNSLMEASIIFFFAVCQQSDKKEICKDQFGFTIFLFILIIL